MVGDRRLMREAVQVKIDWETATSWMNGRCSLTSGQQ